MCPECGSELIVEPGVIRCSQCDWKFTIHDVA